MACLVESFLGQRFEKTANAIRDALLLDGGILSVAFSSILFVKYTTIHLNGEILGGCRVFKCDFRAFLAENNLRMIFRCYTFFRECSGHSEMRFEKSDEIMSETASKSFCEMMRSS